MVLLGERKGTANSIEVCLGHAGCSGAAWPTRSPEAGLLPSLELGCCHFGFVCVLFSP